MSLAKGWIEVAFIVHPPGEVVVSVRPVSVFAKGSGSEIERLRGDLHGRWRQATRAVMAGWDHNPVKASDGEVCDCPVRYQAWRRGHEKRIDRLRAGAAFLTGLAWLSENRTILDMIISGPKPGPMCDVHSNGKDGQVRGSAWGRLQRRRQVHEENPAAGRKRRTGHSWSTSRSWPGQR